MVFLMLQTQYLSFSDVGGFSFTTWFIIKIKVDFVVIKPLQQSDRFSKL